MLMLCSYAVLQTAKSSFDISETVHRKCNTVKEYRKKKKREGADYSGQKCEGKLRYGQVLLQHSVCEFATLCKSTLRTRYGYVRRCKSQLIR